jgi:hypothetical protein
MICGYFVVRIRPEHVFGQPTLDERRRTLISRRDLLFAAAAAAVATTGVASMSPPSAEKRRDKRKPQYRAESPEVQAFYRVNRYPVK